MFGKVFGANVDWISQHSVLPEYFRQQFYATGNLFPEFAANIGGGQNIYNFSYYGLYSPLILPSYFLPFVKMSDYIMAVSIFCLVVDLLLFYKWLRGNEISKGNACLTSVLFLLAGPVIFHSYNQVMFVDYMPFLILGLLGVDRYFKGKKCGLFMISVFLMIMTSFYFSIGGILVLILYGIYRYLTVQETIGRKVTVRMFLWDGVKFCLPILNAVLLAGILLVPTAMTLMHGTREAGKTASLASLFLPDIQLLHVLYQPYGIGLTTLVITVLLTGLTYCTWREKYIHIACILVMTIPLFLYVLNGGLYLRGKVLIPMLPLLCYLIGIYLEKQRKQKISFFQGMVPYVLTLGIVWMGRMDGKEQSYRYLLIADAAVMLLCGLFFYWKRVEKLLIVVPIGCLMLFGYRYQMQADRMLDASFYHRVTDQKFKKTVEQVLEKEQGFYRMEQYGTYTEDAANLNRIWSMEQYSSSIYSSTYEKEYEEFRQNVFGVEQPYRNVLMQVQSKNPIFQSLMGVKYLVSEKAIPGYEEIADGVYENKDALPIAYATNQTISKEEYEKLPFPYNQTAFLSYAVTEKGSGVTAENLLKEQGTHIQKLSLPLDSKIQTKQKIRQKFSIPKAEEGDILLLQFKVKNLKPSKDVSVWVEGIRNKLTAKQHVYYNENETFTYAVPLREGQDFVQIDFGAGSYEISDLQSYLWKSGTETGESGKAALCQGEFLPQKEETKGNVIAGTVDAKEEGYLITSIPYDKNFEVYVDGKIVGNEKVNTAFLGIPLEKGTHKLRIVYHAPGVKVGKMLSIFGILLWIGICRKIATLDGCNRFQIFYKIMLPLTKSSLVALAIMTMKFAWNDLMWPLIVNTSVKKMTLAPLLSSMVSEYGTNYPVQMAGAVMAVLPIVILFIIFQKQFIEGVAHTGVKG